MPYSFRSPHNINISYLQLFTKIAFPFFHSASCCCYHFVLLRLVIKVRKLSHCSYVDPSFLLGFIVSIIRFYSFETATIAVLLPQLPDVIFLLRKTGGKYIQIRGFVSNESDRRDVTSSAISTVINTGQTGAEARGKQAKERHVTRCSINDKND